MSRTTKTPEAALYLAAQDIMRELGVSRSAAYAIIKRMPHFKDGRILRVTRVAFDQYQREQTIPAIPPLRKQPASMFLGRLEVQRVRPSKAQAKPKAAPQQPKIRLTRTPAKLP